MNGREQTGRFYPQIGIREPHHPLTRHQNDPVKMDAIQRYHLRRFADYLEKLRKMPDGDGSLLDNMILLSGAGLSNSDRHTHGPLPTLLLGGGGGTLKIGRHIYLSGTHAIDESAIDAARQTGRPDGKTWRQHRRVQNLSDLSSAAA
jgi:hypothetical protein